MQARKPISTGSEARIVRPVIAMMRAPTFWMTTPATYPQDTRTPDATACHAHERAISDGATLTAYMARAAITPRNDTPMAPIVPGTACPFRRGTRPGLPRTPVIDRRPLPMPEGSSDQFLEPIH